MDSMFNLTSSFQPSGDQPLAIEELSKGIQKGQQHQVLMGATGTGKTFTMANVIQKVNKPTIIIAPNKTLAAQLFTEMKELFPDNAVGFFISYYDYYQPEAYVPTSDTYIAKDSSVNDDIDKMRHEATRNLFERKDVIIIASVSCIYGMGSPQTYAKQVVVLNTDMELERDEFLRQLVAIQYSRNDMSLKRGSFRVRGDVVDILPSHEKNTAIRVEFFGDEVETISFIDSLTGKIRKKVSALSIYPNSHYVTEKEDLRSVVREILEDLGTRLREFKTSDKLVEYQRLEQKTMHDVELLEELGFCPGIENYSRYLTGKKPGEPPPTLLNYFPEGFLTIVDESHITIPQIGGMFRGDQSRKETLVNYGFRLPSALDNRPLNFDEFLEHTSHLLYVSATPGKWEYKVCKGQFSEQIVRPTGILDPEINLFPATNQVDHAYGEIKKTIAKGFRVLVTTLTKKMAEDLTEYLDSLGIKVKYLHADIDSIERVELIRDLRKGEYDVLVGINLLREGLDLPEVALVIVMDADKAGFLRSKSSLIQIVGRAARNIQGTVNFYADEVTEAIKDCMDETARRRQKQTKWNQDQGIDPKTIIKKLPQGLREIYGLSDKNTKESDPAGPDLLKKFNITNQKQLEKMIKTKTNEMKKAAAALDFESAAEIRDTIAALEDMILIFSK